MTLKEKYAVKNKARIGRFICLYSFLALVLLFGSSLALYEVSSEEYAKIKIAGWNIKLNEKSLADLQTGGGGSNTIKLVSSTEISGYDGYFDVKIDPTGTGVSFGYKITLDTGKTRLPGDFNIAAYCVNPTVSGVSKTSLSGDKTVTGEIILDNDKAALGDSDIKTIRYYYKWDGFSGGEDIADYELAINVRLTQKTPSLSAGSLTDAKFDSKVSMSGGLYSKIIVGNINLYMPNWIGGYDAANSVFPVKSIPTEYPNIHYAVTNTDAQGNIVNDEEIDYYLRVVAADDSVNNLPIEYDVHQYNTPGVVYGRDANAGYGPFKLPKGIQSDATYYSLRAKWTSKQSVHTGSIQKLKVQMVRKRNDGSLKVMSEAPLNMQFKNTETVTVIFRYFNNVNRSELTGNKQNLIIAKGTTMDFKNPSSCNAVGIVFPSGFVFYTATSGTLDSSWAGHDNFTIPSDFVGNEIWIEMYMNPSTRSANTLNRDEAAETETETETETEAETETEKETTTQTETETETETQKETKTQTETETQKETKTQTETETQKETKTQAETETQKETKTQAETDTQKETKTQTETETQKETKTQSETQSQEKSSDDVEQPAETEEG